MDMQGQDHWDPGAPPPRPCSLRPPPSISGSLLSLGPRYQQVSSLPLEKHPQFHPFSPTPPTTPGASSPTSHLPPQPGLLLEPRPPFRDTHFPALTAQTGFLSVGNLALPPTVSHQPCEDPCQTPQGHTAGLGAATERKPDLTLASGLSPKPGTISADARAGRSPDSDTQEPSRPSVPMGPREASAMTAWGPDPALPPLRAATGNLGHSCPAGVCLPVPDLRSFLTQPHLSGAGSPECVRSAGIH